MARPSKLSDKQRSEIQRRHLKGETTRSLAREYKVSQASVAALVSGRTETIQTLAVSIARDEAAFDALPVSDQVSVRTIADELKGIQSNLTSAAHSNARTSAHLAKVAEKMAQRISPDSEPEDMRPAVAAIEASNRAGSMGVSLLTANKGKTEDTGITVVASPMDERL